MGAEFNSVIFADRLGKEAIIRLWDDICEQSRHERGHSYSGAIGMLSGSPIWDDTMMATQDEAERHIAEHHEKWSAPYAASFLDGGAKFWVIGGWCAS